VGGAADVEGDRGALFGEEEPVDLVDGESGVLDLGGGVAAQVAAREHCRPDAGLEQALDADEAGGVGTDVFEEAQLPAGHEHAEGLAQRVAGVGDGAQREGEDGGVQAGVRPRQPFGPGIGDLDPDRGLRGGGLGEPAQRGSGSTAWTLVTAGG
jgi:hypothetical protein